MEVQKDVMTDAHMIYSHNAYGELDIFFVLLNVEIEKAQTTSNMKSFVVRDV